MVEEVRLGVRGVVVLVDLLRVVPELRLDPVVLHLPVVATAESARRVGLVGVAEDDLEDVGDVVGGPEVNTDTLVEGTNKPVVVSKQ